MLTHQHGCQTNYNITKLKPIRRSLVHLRDDNPTTLKMIPPLSLSIACTGVLLSAKVLDIQRVQLCSGRILEQGGPILTLALLHPVPIDTERTAINDLK